MAAAGSTARIGSGVPRAARWEFTPTATAIATVRRQLRALLAGHSLPKDPTDAALLVAYELIANAVEHARTPALLTVVLDGAGVHIEVRDTSPAPPRLQPLDPDAVRGRGLQVVDQLTTRWGWATDGPGKAVWADVPIGPYPEPAPAPPAAG